ncbi:hypothetical protein COL26b_010704 [Colletotrichum chrysophilum]|uniref:uncharacterized protein n=1 Tax=Colletotrichum chrysophilum TaxID=1836956 RepID=UPI002301E93E|nr:uncharacterized protein COL26b_010704 [Colletotrichum chrysophilum]KAJ0368818.1 hypothetical protein COL26b_010704 [Colletotrichum chrysophilum]
MTRVRLLLEAGADINATNDDEERPLTRAIRNDQPEVMKCLIEAGAQVTDLLGKQNLLHLAAKEARLKALQYLTDIQLPLLNVYQVDEFGKTPWDDFIMVLRMPEWCLKYWRRPTAPEQDAFVILYKKLRDQSLELDINRLRRTRQYLEDGTCHGAVSVLRSLISEKRDWEQWDSLRTYETIKLQVREQMVEAALESIDENIEVLQEIIDASPWDQVSYWDPREEEQEDDLEDCKKSEWAENKDGGEVEPNEVGNDTSEPASNDL